jgi:hypothetical protein
VPLLNNGVGGRYGTTPIRAMYMGTKKIVGRANLLTNPSMETATAGAVTVRTNESKNPSFEVTSGTAEIRRNYVTVPSFELAVASSTNLRTNLVPNPSATTTANGFVLVQGTGVFAVTRPTTGGVDNGPYVRATATTATTGAGAATYWNTANGSGNMAVISPTAAYAMSAWVRCSVATTVKASVVAHTDSTGAGWTSISTGPLVPVAANVWTKVWVIGTSPAGAGNIFAHGVFELPATLVLPVGGTFDVDHTLIEVSSTFDPVYYFDGVINPDSTGNVNWTGTAHASASNFNRINLEVRRNLASEPRGALTAIPAYTAGWAPRWFGAGGTGTTTYITGAADGPSAAMSSYTRKLWSGASPTSAGDSGFALTNAYLTGGVLSTGLPVLPGVNYTVSCYVRSSSDKDGGWALRMTWRDGAGNTISVVNSASVSLSAGVWTRFALASTAPVGAATMDTVVTNGATPIPTWAAGDTLDGTGLLIERDAGISLPFFDGAYSPDTTLTPAWASTVGGSQSLLYAPKVTGTGQGFISIVRAYQGPGKATPKALVLYRTGPKVTAGDAYAYVTTDTAAPVANRVFTASVSVWAPTTPTVLDGSVVTQATDAGATILGTLIPAGTTISTTPTRYSVSFTVPAGIPNNTLNTVMRAPGTVGTALYYDQLMLEPAANIGAAYFDGATPVADPEQSVAWTGTANASMSTVTGGGVVDVSYGGATVATAYASTVWTSRGTKSLRITPASSLIDTRAGLGGDTGAMRLAMVAGRTYTASAVLHLEKALTGTLGATSRCLVAIWKDSGGTYQSVGSASIPNVDGSTGRVSVTFTIPTGATEAFIRAYDGATYGGGDMWVDEFMLSEGASSTYFDGSMVSTDPDLNYVWSGAANASSSLQRGVGVVGVSAASQTAGFGVQSGQWATANGKKSVRLIVTGTSGDTFANIAGVNTGVTGGVVALTPGVTYTILATLHQSAPLTGTPNSNGSRQIAYLGDGAPVRSAQQANAAGTYQHRITITPTNIAYAQVRLYTGVPAGNGDLWWDDIMIVEGPFTGPYRDGRSPGWVWGGTADASVSYGWN